MVRDQELRTRVERLLAGDIRPEDFSRLFLWLRSRSYGAASIKEIGHFEAHPDERDSGLVTDDARDFFRLIAAAAALKSALSKFHHENDRWQQQECLKITIGTIVARSVFTDDSLFRDFLFVLEKNNLITTPERKSLDGTKAPLALYAISRMHGVQPLLADDWRGSLRAGVHTKADKPMLYVECECPYSC
jgi:hypothetical protein